MRITLQFLNYIFSLLMIQSMWLVLHISKERAEHKEFLEVVANVQDFFD